MRRSFREIKNKEQYYVRLPFDAVPILFFILYLFNCVDENCDKKRYIIRCMGNNPIIEFMYIFHSSAFLNDYKKVTKDLEKNLLDKYKKLHSNLTETDSIMNCNYNEIDWGKLNDYAIK